MVANSKGEVDCMYGLDSSLLEIKSVKRAGCNRGRMRITERLPGLAAKV